MKRASLGTFVLLAGCGLGDDYAMPYGPYVSLDAEPDRLRSDFNAHSDQLRLVFIVGPT